MKRYYRALTIAGSDSGGGAGIQADLKTFAALGCYGLSVVTALTAQNTCGVRAIHSPPAEFAAAQLAVVLDDIGADAVKTGMLHSAEVIAAVAAGLKDRGLPLVVDPVMIAKSGDRLLQAEAVAALREILLPLTTVLTPNLPEAEVLLGRTLESEDQIAEAARELTDLGPRAVVLKGGHFPGPICRDWLYQAEGNQLMALEEPRITTANTHGTGCTFSAALTALLARGMPLAAAVTQAKEYLSGALARGAEYKLGSGHGPVHHFYRIWD